MSPLTSSSTRRSFLATAAATTAVGLTAATGSTGTVQAGEADAIRSYRIDVPEAALTDLRARVVGTRWPPRETVAD